MRIWFQLSLASLLFLQTAKSAEERWIRMRSSDFEIFSAANENNTREILRQFEQVRSFFTQAMNTDVAKSASIRILVFNSKKEYQIYRPNEVADAFYMPSPERDYIVLGGTNSEVFPVAVHEYVHLVARHAGMNLPPWLNEGLAELYSTLRPSGNDVLVGSLIPGRYQALSMDKWVPLEVILSADHNSPYYNEKNKAGSLYNEGWALTHMLALSPAYRPGFSKFIHAIRNGTPSIDALSNTYQKPLGEIERDLIVYLRGGRFQGVLFPFKIEKTSDQVPADPAPAIDVKLTLADLISEPGRENEAEKRLTDLIAENPQRPDPLVALGYLQWRRQKSEEARKNFQKAFALGSRNSRMLWDFGRLTAADNRQEAIQVFGRLLEDEPDRIEVRLAMAEVQLAEKQPQNALQTLRPVKKISSDDAPKFFRMMAYAQLQAGDTAEARNSVQRWAENAKSPDDREDADRFLKYLASLRPGDKPTAAPAPREIEDAGLPPLRRQEEIAETPPPSPPARSNWPSSEETFARLDCEGPSATIVLQTKDGTQKFLIQDPTRVRIDGHAGKTIDLTCGPQSGAPVRIEFETIPNPRGGVSGFVRVIHFIAEGTGK